MLIILSSWLGGWSRLASISRHGAPTAFIDRGRGPKFIPLLDDWILVPIGNLSKRKPSAKFKPLYASAPYAGACDDAVRHSVLGFLHPDALKGYIGRGRAEEGVPKRAFIYLNERYASPHTPRIASVSIYSRVSGTSKPLITQYINGLCNTVRLTF